MSVPGKGPPKQNPQVPPCNDGSGSAGRGATGGASTPQNPRRPPPAEEGRSQSHTPKEEGKPSLADYERLREVVERLTGEKTDALNEIDALVAENRRFQDKQKFWKTKPT